MKIRMTADSTCDLSPELKEKYGVAIAPLSVIIDGNVFHDGVDVTPQDIFRASDEGKSVRTAAVNTYEYKEFFREQLKTCDQVVHVCISSEFSTCYSDAVEASEGMENVFVVDSRNLSTGSGLLVLEGAEMAAAGKDGAEIAETLRSRTGLVDASFVVKTIEYLHRGGRCSGLEALGARLLHIRPTILVRNGRMHPGEKYRGRYEHYMKHYIRDRLADAGDIDPKRVFITHSPSDGDMVRYAIDMVKNTGLFDEVLETEAGCTVCTHCGPNTLGVLFMRRKELGRDS